MASPPDIHALYQLARDHIKHEDELVNHRVTWFLVFQGLLFTALASAVGMLGPAAEVSPEHVRFVVAACGVFAVLGVGSAWVAYGLMRAAYWHIDDVKSWWELQLQCAEHGWQVKPGHACPPLCGAGSRPPTARPVSASSLSAVTFVLALMVAWLILGAFAAPVLWQALYPAH